MTQGLEHLRYGERLREPGEEKAQGDIIHVGRYLSGEVKKTEPGFSQQCPGTGLEARDAHQNPGHFFQIQEETFLLQHSLPREVVVASLSLGILNLRGCSPELLQWLTPL